MPWYPGGDACRKIADLFSSVNYDGSIAANYVYDTWGKLIKITDSSGATKTYDTTFIGRINPLRYRGYYYDSDLSLYYLQTRYYDPNTGRFINADGLVSTGQGITGTNMFAYCSNNPVMMTDTTGQCSGVTVYITTATGEKVPEIYCPCEGSRPVGYIKPKNIIYANINLYALHDNHRYDHDNPFHETAFALEFDKPQISLKDNMVSLGSVGVTVLTGAWEFEHLDLSLLDVGIARASAIYDNGKIDLELLASAYSPSITVKAWDINVKLSADIGAIGAKFKYKKGKIDVGGAFGWGVELSVDY